jgi:hypothetical protein
VTRLADDPGYFRGDPGQAGHAIVNLAVDARDAMLEGGRFAIVTRGRDVSVGREGGAPAPYVVPSVSDIGSGIDEATKRTCSSRSSRRRRRGGAQVPGWRRSTGSCRRPRGHIEVESEPGEGGRSRPPAPHAESCRSGGRLPRQGARQANGERVLVGGGRPGPVPRGSGVLEALGHGPILAANGGEALLATEEAGVRPPSWSSPMRSCRTRAGRSRPIALATSCRTSRPCSCPGPGTSESAPQSSCPSAGHGSGGLLGPTSWLRQSRKGAVREEPKPWDEPAA